MRKIIKMKKKLTIDNFRKEIDKSAKLAYPFFVGLELSNSSRPLRDSKNINLENITHLIEDNVKSVLDIYYMNTNHIPCSAESGYIRAALCKADGLYELSISIALDDHYRCRM